MGSGIALKGRRAIIGMAGYDNGVGRVAVFDLRDGGFWRRAASLSAPAGMQGFGTAVAFNGVVVAASAGRTLLFYRQYSDGWHHTATLTMPDSAIIRFAALKVAGNVFVAAAIRNTVHPLTDPRYDVYVIETDNAGHVLGYAALTSPDSDIEYGFAVSVGGGIVAVGSPNASSVLIYRKTQGAWRQSTRVVPTTTQTSRFGTQVATDGSSLLVTDLIGDQMVFAGGGKVHYFALENGTWVFRNFLALPETGPDFEHNPDTGTVGRDLYVSGKRAFVTASESASEYWGRTVLYVYETNTYVPFEPRRYIWLPREDGAAPALDGDHLLYSRGVPYPDTQFSVGGVDVVDLDIEPQP
jgi:hypothetical protein